ncbi:MAG: membrane protein insertion efficiency factor YidD [Flavobacteriales bacterium]
MALRISIILVLSIKLYDSNLIAQQTDSSLVHAISAAALDSEQSPEKDKRTFLKIRKVKGAKRYNPLLYISSGLVYVYQNIFSEQIQADCNYQLSCSSYTKGCIERHGFFVGLMMGLDQLSSCFEGVKTQYPEYKITSKDLIDNSIEE